MTIEEREVIRRSMLATFHYYDFDFDTRLGVSHEEMRCFLKEWPNIDDSKDETAICIAINNSLNDLLNGQGISDLEAKKLIGVSCDEMRRIYRKWVLGRGWSSTGLM